VHGFSASVCLRAAVAACVLGAPALASAAIQVVTLSASRDATIYGDIPFQAHGNGSGEGLFAGNNGSGYTRRAMLEFDLTGIDTTATILSASLALYADRAPNTSPRTVSLYRLTADWGEGPSNPVDTPGQGVDAKPGDATWFYRYYADPTRMWTSAGGAGDFVATASGSTVVGAELNWYTWSATAGSAANAGMLADLQTWLTHPDANFGWMLRGNESGTQTVKRFGSRELAGFAPQLTLTYEVTPVPEPSAFALTGVGMGLLAFVLRRARRTCTAAA
jgi:hypothetical protein